MSSSGDFLALAAPEKRRSAAVFFIGCALLSATPLPAFAQQDVPFDISSQGWMSLDHYDDKKTRFPDPSEPAVPPQPVATENAAPQQAQPPIETAGPAPKVADEGERKQEEARPDRALNFPVMPGLNKGYDLRVNSTSEDEEGKDEEDAGFAKPTRKLNLPVMPGLARETGAQQSQEAEPATDGVIPGKVDDYMWQDAKKAAKEKFLGQNNKRIKPVAIRFAGLPTVRTGGQAKESPASPVKKAPVPKTPDKNQAALEQQQKACAALTAYRQRQLAAIESDRQTLRALQTAIAELGLNEKIDFGQGVSDGMAGPARQDEETSGGKESAEAEKPSSSAENKTEFLQR